VNTGAALRLARRLRYACRRRCMWGTGARRRLRQPGARGRRCLARSLSNQDHFRPEGFWRAFKDYDGEPINVREHQDAYEFFTRLQARAAASCTRVSRPERAARASPSTCASTRTMPLRATAPRARAQDLVNQPHCAS